MTTDNKDWCEIAEDKLEEFRELANELLDLPAGQYNDSLAVDVYNAARAYVIAKEEFWELPDEERCTKKNAALA